MTGVMTDFQFKSIVKMILRIVKSSKDLGEVSSALEDLLKDKESEEK